MIIRGPNSPSRKSTYRSQKRAQQREKAGQRAQRERTRRAGKVKGQDEVEKSHGEEKAGEVSTGRGDGGVRVMSGGLPAVLKSPSAIALDSHVQGTASIR